MVPPPATMARRERELDAAKTAADVDRLQRKWDFEDDEHERAEQGEAQKLRQLERENVNLHKRLARIEKTLGPGGKTLLDAIAKGFGSATCQRLEELHDVLTKRIADLEARPSGLRYEGVWSSEREYPVGSLVTHGGAGYIAIAPAIKNEKPGTGSSWRLAIKGDEQTLRKLLRDEMKKRPVVK